MSPYFSPFIALLVAVLLLRVLLSPIARQWFLDRPNHRSLHSSPIPRTGGITIVLGTLSSAVWIDTRFVLWVCTMGLTAVSMWDDWRGIHPGWRLAAHLVAATALVFSYGSMLSPPLFIIALLAVAWMTNLYNFMDGSDGLAAGMTVIGFGFYAIAAWMAGSEIYTIVCLCIVTATIPFFMANFAPARVFLGDVGSIPLGFLAAAIGLTGWQKGLWPLHFPLLVFSAFIVDASVTLMKRVARGEKVWQAHHDHYYQRLIRLGWSHRTTAIRAYAVMIVTGSLGLISTLKESWTAGLTLGLTIVLYGVLVRAIDRAWREWLTMENA